MRHDEPDEGDRPGDRGGGTAGDGHEGEPRQPHAPDRAAERGRRVVAEREHRERAHEQQRPDDHDGRERQEPDEVGGVARGHGSHHPGAVVAEGARVGERDHARDGGEARGERGAGEEQAGGIRARPRPHPDEHNDHGGDRGPGERGPRVAGCRPDPEDRDAEHHGERGARVDAEEAGLGERVPGHGLHHDAGDREQHADGHREERARRPQLPDDDRVPAAVVGVLDRVPHGIEGDVAGSRREAHGAQRDERCEGNDRSGGDGRGSGRWHGRVRLP